MTFINRKHYNKLYIIFFLFILNNCQLREPSKQHGVNFLENRAVALIVGKTNKNDVLKLVGQPHSTSIINENVWIYFERTITRGKLIKLGQNVLKSNNVLELEFDKYGVLKNKNIYRKKEMNKVSYSKKETENDITRPSFVSKFFSSVRQKMYGKKKF
jgi:outer membrane protein assembly factor BamE (lipoprotein component of BamABCDE complex)